MSGITDALKSSANHLHSLERSLGIIQSNVGNASTQGYARQDVGSALDSSSANSFLQVSSRDQYAEEAVRRQTSQLGHFDQLSSVLSQVEGNFGASGDSEIPRGISNLFATFSALSINPNDTGSRQLVIDRAGQLARNFNSASASLGTTLADSRRQVSATVDSINHLAGLVRDFNTKQLSNAGAESSLDAKLHATLEQLSEFADVQALRQTDGTVTLLLGGQTALVVGANLYEIQADVTSAPTVSIQDSGGLDITSQISGGRLGGGLKAINELLPGYQDGLNQLAKGIADSVNAALSGGIDANGNPGAPLFAYTDPNASATLAVTAIAPGELAAAAAGSPGGNGNALALSALETSPAVNGLTFSRAYGKLSAGVGRDVADARDSQDFQKQLLSQARERRAEASGVSLDQEAVRLVEYQRAYEATARLVSILDRLSQTTIDMIR